MSASPLRPLALGLQALRARQWLHFLPLPLAGISLFGLVSGSCPLTPVLWAIVAGGLGLGHAYGLNAYCERATDRPGRKNPLAGARVGRLALAPVLLCGALSLVAAGRCGGLGPAAICVAAGGLYSAGPRLKRWPLVGTLTNAAIFAPLLALVGGPRPPGFAGMSAVFVALLLQNQLLHERADADEDRRAGARTTAMLLGPAGLRRALGGLGLVGALAAWPGAAPASWAAGTLGLAFGAACFGRGEAATERRRHRAVALLAGAAMWALAQGGGR